MGYRLLSTIRSPISPIAAAGLQDLLLLFCGRRLLLKVEGESMRPTLNPDDRVLVRRTTADPDIPPLGAVVVAWHPSRPGLRLIKRLQSVGQDGMILLGDNPPPVPIVGSWDQYPDQR